jgi:pilus assembly protein CpaC
MTRQSSTTRTLSRAAVLLAAAANLCTLAAQTGAEDLRLTVGKSIVIDYPSDVRQISTSNPEIVDASPVTTREILVHGRGLGAGTLIVWNKSGDRTFYTITVEANLDSLRRLIKETFPNEDIRVQSSRDAISLNGTISSPVIGERAAALSTSFGKTIVNNLQVTAPPVDKQILLRVKFAELDRTKASQFGVNILSTGATNTIGRITTGQFNSGSVDVSGTGGKSLSISDALNIFAFRPDLNLGAFIKALQSEAILQILAEPNLVTTNGKEASFLVGGEFPVPILQGGSNAAAVTVQFREFGIRLLFTPVVTANKTIKMHLRQEVSTIDLGNAVSLNGFTIPALSTRRAETDIELAEGQSFIVAGLLDNRDTESYSKLPGLGNLPILGELFKTRDIKKNSTELVMIVSPEITHPLAVGEKAPLPNFSNEFLVPLDAASKKAESKTGSKAGSKDEAPAESSAEETGARRHWYSFKKLLN